VVHLLKGVLIHLLSPQVFPASFRATTNILNIDMFYGYLDVPVAQSLAPDPLEYFLLFLVEEGQ